jgi:hypothetical protein
MYKLSVFYRLLHYMLGRAIDTYNFRAVLAVGAIYASFARAHRS